ncbi:SRPBCC family protein [Alteromonadaceae bacterium M269]|nr:SRPBCC family protein [Alteromonadaceae bacterium M269]
MNVSVDINISKPAVEVWAAITDIENCQDMVSSIIDLEVLDKPEKDLVGLKWKETRKMFGKEATETMWITEAVDSQYYCTRAENHGAIYITKLSLAESDGVTTLNMTFSAEAETLGMKIMSAIMGLILKRSMKQALQTDLEDIKRFVEKSHS